VRFKFAHQRQSIGMQIRFDVARERLAKLQARRFTGWSIYPGSTRRSVSLACSSIPFEEYREIAHQSGSVGFRERDCGGSGLRAVASSWLAHFVPLAGPALTRCLAQHFRASHLSVMMRLDLFGSVIACPEIVCFSHHLPCVGTVPPIEAKNRLPRTGVCPTS
jgi:hypothetical protein